MTKGHSKGGSASTYESTVLQEELGNVTQSSLGVLQKGMDMFLNAHNITDYTTYII